MIEQILKDSAYKLSQFSQDEISAVEEKIYKKSNGKFFIKCLIRGEEIQLKPEEVIRQLFIYKLMNQYGYDKKRIDVERGINFGREIKRADIVIMEKDRPTVVYIIVEVKRPNLKDGKEQLRSYCNATGATMGVWTNGNKISFYHRKDPNYFEDIPNIPNANQKLKDILTERWTIQKLIAEDKLSKENKSLKDLILEMEDEVLANAGVDVFEEVFKLIYTKLYDEKLSANTKKQPRFLEFRNYGETDAELKETIQKLFDDAKDKWKGVFVKEDKIKLTPSHLAVCISSLQNVKLFNSNLEVIDEAFEYLMNKSQKGEKGQYFTPRYVIDMCVKMLNPKENEFMIDTAAGSCGFPLHTIFHIWKNFGDDELLTAKDKPPQFIEYVQEKIFAIDFDEKAVRVARTLNLIAGDGKTNVLWLNTLDYERWDEYIDDEDWQRIYLGGWAKLLNLRAVKKDNQNFNFDIVMANPPFAGDIKETRVLHKYELSKKPNGKYQNSMSRDVLFIERNLQFLKPGGRMAIILPQGRFNNSSDKYIRDFIAERCRILAVVGLHGNVFKPHTGTKTSVLFVQKWDDEICPRRDDYPIFFATMKKPSKDNSGEKIYIKNADGSLLRDNNKHLIVEHDLFNHDGLTQDGIFEAFRKFAEDEKLSFFDSSPFDEVHYKNLSEGLECTEILLSELENEFTIGAEYYSKKYINVAKKVLNCANFKKLNDISEIITDGDHGEQIFEDTGVLYLLSESVECGYIKLDKCRYITKDKHQNLERSCLRYGDIVLTKTGVYFGKSAVIPPEITEANTSSHVSKITLKNGYNPYFVSTFLNSDYGYLQLRRRGIKATRPEVTLKEIGDIFVPIFSNDFQNEIERTIKLAYFKIEQSKEVYQSAEKILAQALHLEDFKPSEKNTSEINFSQVSSAGRLDAEYYQPKYYDIENKLNELADGRKICNEFELIKTACDRSENFYNYVEIGDINISTGNAVANLIATDNLPDNAKIMTAAGDVLVSKVRPNRGAVSVLKENNLLVSGAFAVLRTKGNFSANFLQILLRLPVYRELMLRYNVGTSYPVIKDENILNLPLPKIEIKIQEKISALVEKSFELRAESTRLLEMAKSAVELAIERGEEVATEYLRGGNIGT